MGREVVGFVDSSKDKLLAGFPLRLECKSMFEEEDRSPGSPVAMVWLSRVAQWGRLETRYLLLLFVQFYYRDKLATLASQFLSHSFENCAATFVSL